MITLEDNKIYRVRYNIYTDKKDLKDDLLYINNKKLSKLISNAIKRYDLMQVISNYSDFLKMSILIFKCKTKTIYIEWWNL